jgi:hypothetical protein
MPLASVLFGDRRRRMASTFGAASVTLVERLGYGPKDRLLIVNCRRTRDVFFEEVPKLPPGG